MSGGIEWCRWHHGTVDDPKFTLVARTAKQPRHLVLAAWACLLEHASGADPRGDVTACDADLLAVTLDAEPAAIEAILDAMIGRRLIEVGSITDGHAPSRRLRSWAKRQTKTDQERAREYRERQRNQQDNGETSQSITGRVTPSRNITKRHTPSRNVTPRVEERRVEESREEDSYQHQPFGKTPARAEEKIVLARKIVGHFDGCRTEAGFDPRQRPSSRDLPTALGWVEAGADEALAIAIFEAGFDDCKSQDRPPIDALRYFDRPVREALAARGGQAEAETPRRELTEEEGDRIRLDTWVKMSPGHGDRDDAWYSMRYPRPTPAEVAEARRRLGFDQLAETTTGSDSGPDPLTVP